MTVHSNELPSERRYRPWTTLEIRRLAELQSQGLTIRQIAEAIGRPYWGTRSQLVAHGMAKKREPRPNLRTEHDAMLRRDLTSLIERLVAVSGFEREKIVAMIRRRAR